MSEVSNGIHFSEHIVSQIDTIKKRYPEGKQKSALLPVLHLVQAEYDGWLSVPLMDKVAEALNILPIEVYEVASFYTMFNLEPVGKYLIEVCQTSSCWMCGAEDIVAYLEEKHGIKVNEITEDGLFSLKLVECLGSCGTAPMFQIGATYYENLTFEKIDQIIANCRAENKRSRYL
ncbi:MAG: NAD(P)H-dependent oxidoreductase subunit E [Chitinophagales bacterium]|nr:NAD(P)H-dependent oxidoreductase subunit E [Chitinophagales bacterium]